MKTTLEEGFVNELNHELIVASGEGFIKRVEELIKLGADVNFLREGFSKTTPLIAACYGRNPEVVRVLLENGANPNFYAPLTIAYTCVDIVKVLIEFGVDIESRNANQMTILHLAAMSNKNEVIELLAEDGADLEVRDFLSRTPLIIAAMYSSEWNIIKLIGYNANVNAIDIYENTPLIYAAKRKDDTSYHLKLLLKAGAYINFANSEGHTALMSACMSNACINNVRFLIQMGADINDKDKNGDTALVLAIKKRNVEAAKELISTGRLYFKNNVQKGKVVSLAKKSGYYEIGEMLKRYEIKK